VGVREEGLSGLKRQNEKYKQIYNYSIEKLQTLERKLQLIKQEHESEKMLLEGTIDDLKRRIDDKKVNIGHLYSYDNKAGNYLTVQNDRIITETDNENSSSNVETIQKKSPHFSTLSVDSK
jgi:hypothetical protein